MNRTMSLRPPGRPLVRSVTRGTDIGSGSFQDHSRGRWDAVHFPAGILLHGDPPMNEKATDNPAIHLARNKFASGCILISGIGLLVAMAFYGRGSFDSGLAAGRIESFRLDPNEATWSELAQLPAIGETVARRIVGFRERPDIPKPAFRMPRDLDRVPGIGPKTAARIAPFLRFPGS